MINNHPYFNKDKPSSFIDLSQSFVYTNLTIPVSEYIVYQSYIDALKTESNFVNKESLHPPLKKFKI